jgi:hypothetical protein
MSVLNSITGNGLIDFDFRISSKQENFSQFVSTLSQQEPEVVFQKLGELLAIRWNMKSIYGAGTSNLQAAGDSYLELNQISAEINEQLQGYQLLFLDAFKIDPMSIPDLKEIGISIADAIDTEMLNQSENERFTAVTAGNIFMQMLIDHVKD